MSPFEAALTLGSAVLLGLGVPWAFMWMLAPSLMGLPKSTVTNYRGRPVSAGLGIVWLVWSGCAIAEGVLVAAVVADGSLLQLLTLAGPLALVAFALGLVDDAYGSADAKGFRGHVGAMLRGRMTSGGLKLIGIGMASLAAGFVVSPIAAWGGSVSAAGYGLLDIAGALVAGAAIALTSNLINLTDLRPGRALKAYSILSVCGAASVVIGLGLWLRSSAGGGVLPLLVDFGGLLIFLLGPVVAVWRLDLGEFGMLGDAGANPMGAVAGLLIVTGLPFWALLVYTALVFAANAASERISFSRVIEATPALKWIDGLARLPLDDSPSAQEIAESLETDPHDQGAGK